MKAALRAVGEAIGLVDAPVHPVFTPDFLPLLKAAPPEDVVKQTEACTKLWEPIAKFDTANASTAGRANPKLESETKDTAAGLLEYLNQHCPAATPVTPPAAAAVLVVLRYWHKLLEYTNLLSSPVDAVDKLSKALSDRADLFIILREDGLTIVDGMSVCRGRAAALPFVFFPTQIVCRRHESSSGV